MSFEFIVIIGVVLLFVLLGLGIFRKSVNENQNVNLLAEKLAKEIKLQLITASLSPSDYKSEILLPSKLGSSEIVVEIVSNPDNLLRVKDKDSGKTLARAFLPVINVVEEIDPSGKKLIIKKDTGTNLLTASRK